MYSTRVWIAVALAAVGLFINSQSARAESAKDLVGKAIEAHGGADTIKRYPAGRATSKGKINILGMEIAFDAETIYQLPDQGKNTLKIDVVGQKITVLQIFNGG